MEATLRACDLAARYDAHLAAYWRGQVTSAAAFVAWLEAHRRVALPEPTTCPDALSVLGAGGQGVRWYDTDGVVRGFVSGAGWCYEIPRSEVPPACHLDGTVAADLPNDSVQDAVGA